MTPEYDTLPAKPRPQIAPGNEPYWAGLRAHRLLVQRCTGCGKTRHYPRPMCDACYTMDCDWVEIERTGTVHSWTVTHHPFHPGFKRDVPYVTVTADLDAGIRIQAPLTGPGADELRAGLAVVVDFDDAQPDLTFPVVRLRRD